MQPQPAQPVALPPTPTSHTNPTAHPPTLAFLCRWLARLSSLLSLGLIAAFALGEGGSPSLREWGALALFPIGVGLGMLIAWRRELIGGLFSLASLAGFYLYYATLAGKLPHGPYFFLFSSPALLFILSGLLHKPRR